jgi:hypothetical protein
MLEVLYIKKPNLSLLILFSISSHFVWRLSLVPTAVWSRSTTNGGFCLGFHGGGVANGFGLQPYGGVD